MYERTIHHKIKKEKKECPKTIKKIKKKKWPVLRKWKEKNVKKKQYRAKNKK